MADPFAASDAWTQGAGTGGGGFGFESNAFSPPQKETKPKDSDVMLSLLDGFVANTPTKVVPNQSPAPGGAGSSEVKASTASSMGLNAFDDNAFGILNPVPAAAAAPSPAPPTTVASVGLETKPAQTTGPKQFNPMEDEGNPFIDEVVFPVTNAGLELDRRISNHELIPGFEEFVSSQLKHVTIDTPPQVSPGKRSDQGGAIASAAPKSGLPPPVPRRSSQGTKAGPSTTAQASLPSPPPPPAYDDVVKDPPKSKSQSQTKADLQYLWPMPFVQARLKPLDKENSAALQVLAGNATTLVASPNKYGSLRVWRNANTSLDMTRAELEKYGSYVVREDGDSCPAIDVPNRVEGKITCITVDEETKKIWAGHASGEVTYWDLETLKFLHVFQAHRNGSVNAIVITAYGDVWTGSSRGSLRLWKSGGKVLPRSGQNSFELRRSNGDRAHGKIQALLYVPSANIIWSAGIHSLALWDATTGMHISSVGELEKQTLSALETSYDQGWSGRSMQSASQYSRQSSIPREPALQRRASMTSERSDSDYDLGDWGSDLGSARSRASSEAPGRGKKQLGSITSRASKLLGKGLKLGKKAVAKSVDKVYSATSGVEKEGVQLGETLATVLDANNNVWVVYNNGVVEIYSKVGTIIKSWQEATVVTCVCAVGSYVWAGLAHGQIKVWDSSYEISAVWKGHQSHLISICAISSRVYTLSMDGCINGWHYKCPIEWKEEYASSILKQTSSFVNTVQMTVFAGTWNVNQMNLGGIRSALPKWFEVGSKSADIAIIGLQEVEMGARTVAESIVKETFAKGMQEKGNLAAQTWFQEILGALCRTSNHQWHRVGSRQLSGILLGVYVRDHLKKATGEVDTCSVARGVMGVGGNKGTVAVSLSIFRRKFLFLCSHFAAHQNAVAKRNEDYMAPARELKLSSASELGQDAGTSPYQESALFRDAHLIVWVGDFNYRVDMPYSQACHAAYNGDYGSLQSQDQCLREMAKGNTFVNFKEGALNFPPTYKFDKRTSTYDTSEKQRIPAWCDRVLYRTKADSRLVLPGYGNLGPKFSANFPPEPVSCCLQTYDSCHNIVESDHKPVYAVMNIGLRCVDESCHRRLSVEVMEGLDRARVSGTAAPGAMAALEFDQTPPEDAKKSGFTITNAGDQEIEFDIVNADERSQTFLPHLVLLLPSRGILEPKTSQTITVAVNSDPSLSQDIHRMEQVRLRVTYWVYGLKTTTVQTKVITTQMKYERYFHSI